MNIILTANTYRGLQIIPPNRQIFLGNYYYQFMIPFTIINNGLWPFRIQRLRMLSSPSDNCYINNADNLDGHIIMPLGRKTFRMHIRRIGFTRAIIELLGPDSYENYWYLAANIVDY